MPQSFTATFETDGTVNEFRVVEDLATFLKSQGWTFKTLGVSTGAGVAKALYDDVEDDLDDLQRENYYGRLTPNSERKHPTKDND